MDTYNRFEADVGDSALPQDPIEVLRIAWQRKYLIILSLSLCIGMGAVYWYLAPRIYSSNAQVLVIKTTDGSVSPGVESKELKLSYFQDYMSAHETLMKSRLLVGRAVKEYRLDELQHIASNPKYVKNPTNAIIKNLSVARDFSGEFEDASAVLDLSYRSTDPAECQVVLSAIIGTYNDYLQENDLGGTKKIRGLVSQWNDQIQVQLTAKKEAYMKLRESTSDLVSKGSGGFAVSQSRLETIAAERLPHTIRKQQIQHQLEALQSAKASGLDHSVLMGMVSRWYVADSKPDDFHRAELLDAMKQLQALQGKFGPGHPLVVAIRDRLKLIKDMNVGTNEDSSLPKFVDPVESFMEALRRELDVSNGIEATLTRLLEEEHKKTQLANAVSTDLDDLRTEIADLQLLQRSVIQQVQSLDFADQSGLYDSQVIATPERGVKIAPDAVLILAIAFVCGIVLGATLVFLAEIIDQSFRNTAELHRKFGLPVLGSLPRLKRLRTRRWRRRSGAVHAGIHTHHRPNSREADAFRAIRIAVESSIRRNGSQVIQVTSPKEGDGASTLVANLAISMAQTGKKVLIVDADLRNPCQHQLFGLANVDGLTSVLDEKLPVEESPILTDVPGLWLLPPGPEPWNAAEALNSVQFCQSMNALRELFDLIIVDTPGILTNTDPCIVADNVDSVIVVVKNSLQCRQKTEQAIGRLMMTDVEVLGIVIAAAKRRDTLHRNGTPYRQREVRSTLPNRGGPGNGSPNGETARRKRSLETTAPAGVNDR